MKDILVLFVHSLVTFAKLIGPGGAKALVAENLLLKQQLLVINRSRQRAPNLTTAYRIVFGLGTLFLLPNRITKVSVIIRPSTLLKFHQYLVRRKYRLLFSPLTQTKPGPKGPSGQLIHAIVELKRRNPNFGCPRIAMIISKTFGIEIDKDVVRRVLAKHYHPQPGDGPSWLTFIGYMKDSLWSIDFFRCESITLKSHWVFSDGKAELFAMSSLPIRRHFPLRGEANPYDSDWAAYFHRRATRQGPLRVVLPEWISA